MAAGGIDVSVAGRSRRQSPSRLGSMQQRSRAIPQPGIETLAATQGADPPGSGEMALFKWRRLSGL